MKNSNILYISICIILFLSINLVIIISPVFAQNPPSSSNYKVLEYSLGAGGTASSSSNTYSLFGSLGQVDQGSPSSTNYFIGAGLEYEIMATSPAAPTFVNSGSNYNKLHITINRGGNDSSDYQYAIAISTDNFATTSYVQQDHTISDVLNNNNWQTYSSWGGASGIDIIGLDPGTTYYARVSARQGEFFTQSYWSPIATATTTNPTLSFDIDVSTTGTESAPPYILSLGNLTPDSVTTSTNRVWVDVSTNATNGVFISVNGSNAGLQSSTASYTISSSTNDLTAQPDGYGARSYSTNQDSGGPMQAVSPYNGSGNNVGVLDASQRYMFNSSQSPVTNGKVAFEIKAKASNTTPSANDYADVLTVIATGSF